MLTKIKQWWKNEPKPKTWGDTCTEALIEVEKVVDKAIDIKDKVEELIGGKDNPNK